MPPVSGPMVCAASSSAARLASRTAATTRSCSVSMSSGSTALGSMTSAVSSPAPVSVARTRPPPAVPSTVAAASSSCAAASSLLHLLRLLHQLLHVRLRRHAREPTAQRPTNVARLADVRLAS